MKPSADTVTIKSAQTLWQSQQTPIEIALPAVFRRSGFRRIASVVLPIVIVGVVLAVPVFNSRGARAPEFSLEVHGRYVPVLLPLLGVAALLGFLFLHRLMNWPANLLLDWSGGVSILVDTQGLTDLRVAMHRIEWSDICSVKIVAHRAIDEVELELKHGARFEPRKFRLDYRMFNAVVRRGKGQIVGIDVKYFDASPYVLASVIEALASRDPT